MIDKIIYESASVLIYGISLWLAVKIVDIENKSNKLIYSLIFGLIIYLIMLIPGYIIPILIVLLFLSFIFKQYDLSIGEAIVALILMVVFFLIIGVAIGWIMEIAGIKPEGT